MAFKNLFSNKKEVVSEPMTVSNKPGEDDAHEGKKRNPQNDNLRTRCEVLKLRLTKEEKKLISEKAVKADMSMTDYIMATVKETQIIVIDNIPQVYTELLRQGNNLNQLVRVAHQTGAEELVGVEDAVKQCSETCKKLMRFCEKWDVKLRSSKKKKGE